MKARSFRVRVTALFSLALFAAILITVPEQSEASYGRVPSFKVYPNGSAKATWNTPVGDFSYIESCEALRPDLYRNGMGDSRGRAPRPNVGQHEPEDYAPYSVWCRRELELPIELTFWDEINIGGHERRPSDFGGSNAWSVRSPLSFIQKSLANDEVFDAEVHKKGFHSRLNPSESHTFSFRPPVGYAAYLTEFFEEADELNRQAAVAKQAEDKRQRIILGGSLIGGVIALALLVKLLRSGPVRRGARVVHSRIATFFSRLAGLVRRLKISFKRKGNMKAAQELMYWSELKDKGDISQEEFEERKKELLGET
ncbi:SHOCT domain-containing protein [Wenzhouxiangella sp. XN201]|uniref:SHOCT domain-containing protein n=1 Tax=Wenzhouxiangella sp. XN201 TaxID=2710755 RepID=UPI0013CB5294|nr:SHOCT domain-containing protein [Wenzhouxiangella sp. XN201]NEZ02796.1 SHOCT domain-containing protein [Wenzhouxiangella sp. XN201]